MSATFRALRRTSVLGGALVPTAVIAAVLGAPAASGAPAHSFSDTGAAPPATAAPASAAPARILGPVHAAATEPLALFDVAEAVPGSPDLLRQMRWIREGEVPAAAAADLRVATFSAGLTRSAPGELADELSAPGSEQGRQVAETIQRAAPDVVLLTDFDVDGGDEVAQSFRANYLAVGTGGQEGIDYPYVYTAEVNNGVGTGADLDDDGVIGGAGDAFGPGSFAGQHGMALFSRYPLKSEEIRTFRDLRWNAMPGNAIPDGKYTQLERSVLRLSSTSHWDVPVEVDGQTVHILASQPVDPGTGSSDQDRHHDQMRFWADYVRGGAGYIEDDAGQAGGLPAGEDFVLAGDFGPSTGTDLESDPQAHPSPIGGLLDDEVIQDPEPESAGARAAGLEQATATEVTDAGAGPLQLERSDFLFPSASLTTSASGVFWPAPGQVGSHLTHVVRPGMDSSVTDSSTPSDHRLVWVDLSLD